MTFVDVAINVPLNKAFTYNVPEEKTALAQPGMRVVIPFRKRDRVGYIVDINTRPTTKADIKAVLSLPDTEPIISSKMLKLLRWISDYYSAPIGEIFASATPNLLNNVKEIGKNRKISKVQDDLRGFRKDGKFELNSAQRSVLEKLTGELGKFSVSLLHGVTGSGKTEVYLKLIEKIIGSGGRAILLVPEISLTPQLAGRVVSHFGENVAIYHSGLSEAQRLNQWTRAKDGKVNVVVGTRSAVFAPLKDLGLIIVDEEHDNSYKQEESPRYNARDTAIMRAKIEGAMVLLGSATPSIETLANARSKKYQHLHLPERHGETKMPEIKIVDMRKEPRSELLNPHLSIELMSEIKNTVREGHQVLLFLNRRGFANFFLCQDCGYIPECPNCRITLTYHKKAGSLICHYCDLKKIAPDTCPECNGVDFILIGTGTEMIEEIIQKNVPGARIARLDRDTATTEKKRREILSKMHEGELNILIGTQMITKGHDFPNITLVGIISADQSIHFPDFRSSERTFQLLTQVSGRAGRSANPGKVIVQTYSPENISIKTASEGRLNDYIASELAVRKELLYPPFARLTNIRISGNSENSVADTAKRLVKLLGKATDGGLKLLGPAPAPISMIRGRHRWQILIKSSSARLMAVTLAALNNHLDAHPPTGVKVAIDVDPVSTM